MKLLVSAGEASGDMYAAGVVNHLARLYPGVAFEGCAGPKLQSAGVRPVVDAASLAVVGLAEVVGHLPRIYGEYRKLVRHAEAAKPHAALLTDSPDFHLRLAKHLKRQGVPVFYLVAPQVWAWRQGRVKAIAKLVDHLFCLFPFEEQWFRERGVNATYIGHPLAQTVRASSSRSDFLARHDIVDDAPVLVLLPGSRGGEIDRHVPVLLETVRLLRARMRLNVMLATPKGFHSQARLERFREPMNALSIQVVEGETWDCIAHADVALAASGTVTVEAAILATPMVTFYRVNPLSWYGGRHLVKAPFLSMVNLIAGRKIVPELIQHDMTPEQLAAEASRLLTDSAAAERMRADLHDVRDSLQVQHDPFALVAETIAAKLRRPIASDSGAGRR